MKEADLEAMGRNAMNDVCRITNPRQPVTPETVVFLIRSAMETTAMKAAGV